MEMTQPENGELSDVMQIDDMLIKIEAIEKQIEDYKTLKKRRTTAIDREIASLEETEKFMRENIAACMKNNKETYLNFPGVGSVSLKNKKEVWEVLDEEKMISFIKNNCKKEEKDKVLKETVKIVKKNLDPILDAMVGTTQIPEEIAKKEKDKFTLSIQLDKENRDNLIKEAKPSILNIQEKHATIVEEQFDSLNGW